MTWDPQTLLLAGFAVTVTLSLAVGSWGRRHSSGSLVSFFWGDNNLSVAQGTHLNLSTSFAVNGILYSAWLGYIAGWASVWPQVIWCAGFLVLARYAKRLGHLSRTGTLHGNIGYVFGKRAAQIAALASIIGFTLLFGWELYIGSSMFRAVLPSHSSSIETTIYFSLAIIAAIYCMLGGLRGNLHANEIQNYISGIAVAIAIFWLWKYVPNTQPFTWHDFVDWKTYSALAVELTFAGIITNAVLFMVYQFTDMSVWQNIASVSDEGKKSFRTLVYSSIWVLFFPGVTGTALGMLMRSYHTGITADNIVPELLHHVSSQPWLFFVLVMGFFAMMLSTVDGFLLAACQAVTWDLTDREAVLKILTARGSPDVIASDLTDPRGLAVQLVEETNPISVYVLSMASAEERTAIGNYATCDEDLLLHSLVNMLNRVISHGSIYDEERFSAVQLRKETIDLLSINPVDGKLRLLNRWLLEEAYPQGITYNHYSTTVRREKAYGDPAWDLDGLALRSAENKSLDHARYAILAIALLGGAATLYLLRLFPKVNAFNLLYITYVAQMSLFPVIWVILHGERRIQPRGALSIGLGLLAGFLAVGYGLALDPNFAPWAPTVAVAAAAAVYWPFRKFPQSSQSRVTS